MMNTTDNRSRKTKSLLAKNLIILLALVFIVGLSIWAWFTSHAEASASGISVQASVSKGLQVSWDNINWYDNLTAMSDAETSDTNGLATNITDGSKLKLVTGDGINFFAPDINKRTGNPITNADDSLSGIAVDSASGKYVDVDLYFRSQDAKDITLSKDSEVSPKSTAERMSSYGNFSTDYICSTARLAFLNAAKDTASFIWAPNSNYELKESGGYTKLTTTDKETVQETITSSLDGGATEDGSTYKLWSIPETADYQNGDQRLLTQEYTLTYDSDIKYYTTTITLKVPSYAQSNPSVPFLITKNGIQYNLDAQASCNNNVGASLLKISNQDYNGAWYQNSSNVTCNQFYITDTSTLVAGSTFFVKFGYNPQTNVATILGYTGNDPWDRGSSTTTIDVEKTYFPLDGAVNLAIASPSAMKAVSANYSDGKDVLITDNKISPLSILRSEMFTSVKTGDKSSATYKFRNVADTSKYLSVDADGNVTLSSTQSSFELKYIEGLDCPALVCNNYYLEYDGTRFVGVDESNFNQNLVVTVYTGSSFTMDLNSTNLQEYKYYSNTTKDYVTLNNNSSPKLYSSATTDTGTIPTIVTTLEKDNTDGYYKSHIVVRIWSEGTDRDAQTPLAGGMYQAKLHFTGIPKE